MELIINNGKIVEPSTKDKIKATLTRDKWATLVLPFDDIHQMVANSVLGQGGTWMQKYKFCTMSYNNSDNSFTITLKPEQSSRDSDNDNK